MRDAQRTRDRLCVYLFVAAVCAKSVAAFVNSPESITPPMQPIIALTTLPSAYWHSRPLPHINHTTAAKAAAATTTTITTTMRRSLLPVNKTITTVTAAAPPLPPGEPKSTRNCEEWHQLFAHLNHYFRNEDILQGSDHSSVLVGYLIIGGYSIVITFGAIGNLLTITAVLRNPQIRTVRNFFILNLALSDFFICTVTAPITLYTVLYMFWPFGTAFCKIVGSLQGFNIFLSTFSITAIALDRYVLVIFPTQRDRQKNLALLFFLLIWLISILLALPLFVASDLEQIFRKDDCSILLTICHEQNQRWQQMALSKEVYTVSVLFIQYAFPLASIVFAYSRIARRMGNRFAPRQSSMLLPNNTVPTKESVGNQKCEMDAPPMTLRTTDEACALIRDDAAEQQQKEKQRQTSTTTNGGYCTVHNHNNNNIGYTTSPYNNNNYNKKAGSINSTQFDRAKRSKDRYRRTNYLLIAVVCVFAAAWLPLNIFHLINTFHNASRFSVPAFALCHCLAIGSACLNPVSYAFFNHHFRTEFIAIFRKLRLIWLYHYCVNLSKTLRLRRDDAKLRVIKRRKHMIAVERKDDQSSSHPSMAAAVSASGDVLIRVQPLADALSDMVATVAMVDSAPATILDDVSTTNEANGALTREFSASPAATTKSNMPEWRRADENEDEHSTHYL